MGAKGSVEAAKLNAENWSHLSEVIVTFLHYQKVMWDKIWSVKSLKRDPKFDSHEY